jgi:hypothetical protein
MSTIAIQPSSRQKGSARASAARIAAVVAACLLVSFLVVQETRAAFTDTTDNTGNQFSTTEIRLIDDDSGSAMFNVTDLAPGDSVTECINVEYDGDITGVGALTPVRMYGSAPAGGLASELEVSVRPGTGGSFGNCAGFAPSGPTFGPVALNAQPASWAASTWNIFTPVNAGDNATVEVTVTLPSSATNVSMNQTTTATFVWEVQTT